MRLALTLTVASLVFTATAGAHNGPSSDARWTHTLTEAVVLTNGPVLPVTITKPYRFYVLKGDITDVDCWGIDGAQRVGGVRFYKHLGCYITTEDSFTGKRHDYEVVVHPLDNEDFFVVSGAHLWNPAAKKR